MKNTPPQGGAAPWGRRQRRSWTGVFFKLILKIVAFFSRFAEHMPSPIFTNALKQGFSGSHYFPRHASSQGCRFRGKKRPLPGTATKTTPARCFENRNFGHELGAHGFPRHETLPQRSATPPPTFLTTSQAPETPFSTHKMQKNPKNKTCMFFVFLLLPEGRTEAEFFRNTIS